MDISIATDSTINTLDTEMSEVFDSPTPYAAFKQQFSEYTTLILGHRGGYFGPENSMKGFKGALDNNLEGIEFDVWLSKDEVPMVVHGGNDGELSLYGLREERVFDWTSEQLKTLDIGESEVMPTLEELLTLYDGANMLLNIELKGPLSPEWKARYDYKRTCQLVHDMVVKF